MLGPVREDIKAPKAAPTSVTGGPLGPVREDVNASYDRTIAENLGEQYDSVKSQDPKAASDILRRIESLRRQKADRDADYARRITDIEQQTEIEKASLAEEPSGQKPEAEAKYSLRDVQIPTRENLNQKPPMKVVDISKPNTTGTFRERRGDIVKNAQEAMKKPYLNRDTGATVFISKASYNHAFSNVGEIQLNAVEHLPELIETAVLTHSEQSTHGSPYTTGVYTFFSAVKSGEAVLPVKIKVKEYAVDGQALPANIAEYFRDNPKEYASVYDSVVLEVQEIEESSRGSGTVIQMNKSDESGAPQELSFIRVSDLLDRVKGDAEKYIPKPEQPGTAQAGGAPVEVQTASNPMADEAGEHLATKPVSKQTAANIENSRKELETVGIMRRTLIIKRAEGTFLLLFSLKQDTGGIGDGAFSIVIGKVVFPTYIRHKQAVPFHGSAGFFREPAGLRVGALGADPAPAGAQAQCVGIMLLDLVGGTVQVFHMPLFSGHCAPPIYTFFELSLRLHQNPVSKAVHPLLALLQGAAMGGTGPVLVISVALIRRAHLPDVFSCFQR